MSSRPSRAFDGDAGDALPADTGPLGPVAVFAFLFLLVASPLMRGGNRQVALIVLEAAALVCLAALAPRAGRIFTRLGWREAALLVLLASPLWLAALYLLPLPTGLWETFAGRAEYTKLLAGAGIDPGGWLALSLAPDATRVSLFAGIPLVAAFLAGYASDADRMKLFLRVIVGMALVQIVIGLLQAAGGSQSALHFGAAGNRPFGTFANPNHFANYIAMALAAYAWLAWIRLARTREAHAPGRRHSRGRTLALWAFGGLLLLVGILMSRSRGASLAGIPAAVLVVLLVLALGTRFRSWRTLGVMVAAAMVVGVSIVGYEMLATRFDVDQMVLDAPKRTVQAATTLQGAWTFWPWGAGWGTYYEVYPRFQPADLVGTADYAHHDHAQMLFEGGAFAALLMLAFAALAVNRALALWRIAQRERRLGREEMACAVCGLGLLGFLLHSFVEFNMHIPANAIVASLLAGVFLRPLPQRAAEDAADD